MPDSVDPYLDPETGILRNKVGATTKAELDEAEADLVPSRVLWLVEHYVPATGDLAELQAIHRCLFQDVYAWAGELRTVDVRKYRPGAEPFLPVAMIRQASAYSSDELAAENFLKGLARVAFVERLAHHYDQFNYIHPFREGNGRVQRVFWNRIVRDAGWQLDWSRVSGEENDRSSWIASEKQDLSLLKEMFNRIVEVAGPDFERGRSWPKDERLRLSVRQAPEWP